jgi:hypothetical protein
MNEITTTRPYVEHPMNIDVTCGDESDRHVLTPTDDGLVRVELAGSNYASLVTPAEARAIAAGLLVIADEADERQAELDAQAFTPPTHDTDGSSVAEIKACCANMEDLLDAGEVMDTRSGCGIEPEGDIKSTNLKRPGMRRYYDALAEAVKQASGRGEE